METPSNTLMSKMEEAGMGDGRERSRHSVFAASGAFFQIDSGRMWPCRLTYSVPVIPQLVLTGI